MPPPFQRRPDPQHDATALQHPETSAPAPVEPGHERWRLMRDALVFQGKLFLDGLKDIVLAPVAALAAIASLLFERRRPGRTFYEVLRMGRGFDRWINLFGALESRSKDAARGGAPPTAKEGVDAYVRRLEAVLVEQHRRGGLTAKAKDAIDRALDTVHRVPRGGPPPGGSTAMRDPSRPDDYTHGGSGDGTQHR